MTSTLSTSPGNEELNSRNLNNFIPNVIVIEIPGYKP